jgi:tRNA (guanine37-N1)-methyltransferase
MRIDILTLFPKMFENVLGESMLKRAQDKGLVKIAVHNLRDWTSDSHRTADDKPFGGGPGMVMKVEPIYRALEALKVFRSTLDARRSTKAGCKVILLTPQGKRLEQRDVRRLAKEKRLIMICGHYEGVDERIRGLVDEEISIGDYILTCGEIPAMALVDAVVRLIPGVLGHKESAKSESFEEGLLEYPQYTRPAEFMGMRAPDVLTSGDHKEIEAWRRREALKRTKERRPDLIECKVQSAKHKTKV